MTNIEILKVLYQVKLDYIWGLNKSPDVLRQRYMNHGFCNYFTYYLNTIGDICAYTPFAELGYTIGRLDAWNGHWHEAGDIKSRLQQIIETIKRLENANYINISQDGHPFQFGGEPSLDNSEQKSNECEGDEHISHQELHTLSSRQGKQNNSNWLSRWKREVAKYF